MVISARHLLATRANLRLAHERQQEKALWEEEHGSCRACEYDNNSDPHARCNGCINGDGKSAFIYPDLDFLSNSLICLVMLLCNIVNC